MASIRHIRPTISAIRTASHGLHAQSLQQTCHRALKSRASVRCFALGSNTTSWSRQQPVSSCRRSIGTRRRTDPGTDVSQPDDTPGTDFESLDIFGDTPVPPTSVDACLPDGFRLNNGVQVSDGSGVLLVGGEAFSWRPWGTRKALINARGQWEVGDEAFGLLGLVWPRPDLLILGLGPEIRPLSPATKQYITSLGMRVEVLDTRNAASQFNMLATERGIEDIAAALVPVGWRDQAGTE